MGRYNTRKRDRQNSLCKTISVDLANIASADSITDVTVTDPALAAMKTNWVVTAQWAGTPDAKVMIMGARCATNGVLTLVLYNPIQANANVGATNLNVIASEPDL